MNVDLSQIRFQEPELIRGSHCALCAVCLPLLPRDGRDFDLLFEQRSSGVEDQPGDVCLPGGMWEEGESLADCALRECREELLLKPEQLTLLGEAHILHNDSVELHSFAALLTDYDGRFNAEEVAGVFTVPLSFFLEHEPEHYEIEEKPVAPADFPWDAVQGGRNYRWRRQIRDMYFYRYENRVIWGMTAALVRAFAERIKKSRESSCRS